MSAPLWLDALRRDSGPPSRAGLVSQALRLRWQVLEHARLGEGSLAWQNFRALQDVAAQLRGRADLTQDDMRLVDLCVREADLAVLTCRVARETHQRAACSQGEDCRQRKLAPLPEGYVAPK
jgi:hypothetical protein